MSFGYQVLGFGAGSSAAKIDADYLVSIDNDVFVKENFKQNIWWCVRKSF